MSQITRVIVLEANTKANAEDVNAMVENIHNVINGGLDDANISEGGLNLADVGENRSLSIALIPDDLITPNKLNIDGDLDFQNYKASNLDKGEDPSDAVVLQQLNNLEGKITSDSGKVSLTGQGTGSLSFSDTYKEACAFMGAAQADFAGSAVDSQGASFTSWIKNDGNITGMNYEYYAEGGHDFNAYWNVLGLEA